MAFHCHLLYFLITLKLSFCADLWLISPPVTAKPKPKAVRDDIEKGDQEEQYYEFMKKNPKAGKAFTEGVSDEEETDIVYDEEGNAKKVKKEIDPLPPINHAKISYLPIEKNLYKVHADVESCSKTQINKLLGEIGIRIQGYQPQVVFLS